MNRITFPGKRQSESINLQFDFTSQLAAGETLVSAGVTATVYSGVDPTPQTIVGAGNTGPTIVTVKISNGVLGTIYELLCQASTSQAQLIDLCGALAIIPDLQ